MLNRQIVESRTKCRDLLVSAQELPLRFAYCSSFSARIGIFLHCKFIERRNRVELLAIDIIEDDSDR